MRGLAAGEPCRQAFGIGVGAAAILGLLCSVFVRGLNELVILVCVRFLPGKRKLLVAVDWIAAAGEYFFLEHGTRWRSEHPFPAKKIPHHPTSM